MKKKEEEEKIDSFLKDGIGIQYPISNIQYWILDMDIEYDIVEY